LWKLYGQNRFSSHKFGVCSENWLVSLAGSFTDCWFAVILSLDSEVINADWGLGVIFSDPIPSIPFVGELNWQGCNRVLWWWTSGELIFVLCFLLFINYWANFLIYCSCYSNWWLIPSWSVYSTCFNFLFGIGQEFHINWGSSCWYSFSATLWCKLTPFFPIYPSF